MPDSDAVAAEISHVTVDLARRRVLNDVSLIIPAGCLTAIVGPNGCGKSTIARMLSGFLYPTRGVVRILGHTLGEVNVHSLRERVKLVQPTPPHEPSELMSVRDVVLTGAFGTVDLHDVPSAHDEQRADETIAHLHLGAVVESNYRICSTGERMRTQIARALMMRPALLILDEPTNGLDLPAREQLLTTLDTLLASPTSPAILLVTHHVEELPLATRQVILMSAAHVVKIGAPADVLRSDRMSDAFGWPIEMSTHDGRYYARAKAGDVVDVPL